MAKKQSDGFRKLFYKFFPGPKKVPISKDIPEGLPESIEEMNKLVNNLCNQLNDFSEENKRLAKEMNEGLRMRQILLVISTISIIINILLIFRVK